MATTTNISPAVAAKPATQTQTQTQSNDFWTNLEFYRFTLVVVALAAAGCGGGVAAYWAISMPVWVLALTVCGAMLTLSFVISVSPVKWITYAAIAAVAVDVAVVTAGLLS